MGIKLFSFASLAVFGIGYVALQQMNAPHEFARVDGRITKVEEICRYELHAGARSKETPCDQAVRPDGEWAGATLRRLHRVEVFYVSPVDRQMHSAMFVTRDDAPRVGQTYGIYAHTSHLGMIRDF